MCRRGSSPDSEAIASPADIEYRFARPALLLLAAILLLAAGLRLHGLGTSSYWYDESCSLLRAMGHFDDYISLSREVIIANPPVLMRLSSARPWWTIWTSSGVDPNPPLYFLLLRAWLWVFRESDGSGRALSAAASIMAVAVLFDLVRFLIGTGPALWACLMMAVASPQIYYAQEARSYALLVLAGLGGAAALVRIEKLGPNRLRVTAMFVCTTAMLMTHYFASGAAAALGLYAVLRLHGRARTFAIGSLLAAVVVFLAVWGPFIKPKDAQIGLEWLRENPQGHVIRTLGRAAVLPVRFFAELPRGLLRLSELATIAGLLPLYLLLSGKRRDLLLPVLWVICIIGSVAMLDVVRSTYQLGISRYTLLAAPGAFMLAAASLWHLRHAWRHAVPAAAVLLSAVATFRGGPFEKPDWRGLGAEIGRRVAPGELVVFAARDPARVGPLWQAQRRYICVRRYTELAESVHLVLLLSAPPSDEVRRRIDAAVADSQVWVVADSDPKSPDTLSVLPGYRLETGAAFGGAGALFRIVPPSPSAPPRS